MDMSSEDKPNLFHNLFKSFNKEQEAPIVPKHSGPSTAPELDIKFAENFSANSGKFVYCQNYKEFFILLDSLKKQNDWNYVFSWDPAIKKLMANADFQSTTIGFFMDNSDAALSQCYGVLADEGLIMLTPDQATNRRLTSFPPNHIILASKDNMYQDLEAALKNFNAEYEDKLPSLIELGENRPVCKANHARLLNAEGTPNVFVFYVDSPEIG